MTDLKKVLKSLPAKPGVYRFYAMDKVLLYVGKAKNLKNRVSSYFQEGRPKNQRLSLMISQIAAIEYTVVESEKDSLILEANLIHSLQPKYNILLKDDKSYVYVRFAPGVIPGIFLVRRKFDPKSEYFGPYTKRSGIYHTLQMLRGIFPYCQEKTPGSRVCNYYGIRQCEGICAGLENREEYLHKLEQIKNVLRGRTQEVENELSAKIAQAIAVDNFELAALWRDRLHLLRETVGTQKIILPHPQDLDVLTLVVQEDGEGLQIGSVFVQTVRQGKIINVNNFLLSGTEDLDDFGLNLESAPAKVAGNFLSRFFSSYFALQMDTAEVLLNVFYTDGSEIDRVELDTGLKSLLEELGGVKVYLRNTFSLNRKEIGDLALQGRTNAVVYLERNRLGQRLSLFEENNLYTALVSLQRQLGLLKVPRRIECFDISHLSGKYVYGSLVSFVDGRPAKKYYKLFKTREKNDDFANHQEVLRRRLQRALDLAKTVKDGLGLGMGNQAWELPDLIIIDGGKGQLAADMEVLEEYRSRFAEFGLGLNLEVCALAKREEEVFLPRDHILPTGLSLGLQGGVLLSGEAKFLVQRIRDEAHRFAITNNRKARLRQVSKSSLDGIAGIGPKTSLKLLQAFGSVENLVDNLYTNPELVHEVVGGKIVEKLKNHMGINPLTGKE